MIDRSLNYGRESIRRFLEQSGPYGSVLDLGAGSGDDLALAEETRPDVELFGVEENPHCVGKLSKRGVKVFRLNIEKDRLPFKDDKVDVVIANQVLEHTKEVFWILHEISRVLPVGGRLLLGVPNMAALHNRILLALGIQPSPCKTNSAHVRGFTKGDILKFLESCSPGLYRLRGFRGANFYPFPSFLARPLARLFPTMAWGIFFHFEKTREYEGGFVDFPRVNNLETNFYLGPKK